MSKNYNVILGSGLTSLITKKILPDYKIIPLGPSRFYSQGVPGWGDDFISYDESIIDIVKSWNFNTIPLIYKRPFSISGSLLYSHQFIDQYFDRIGISDYPISREIYKTDLMVFPFSCIQLWDKLLRECISEIKSFYDDHNNAKYISGISDHKISLNNGDIIEYDKMISTVPYNVLCKYLNVQDNNKYSDTYYYFINDGKIDLEGANQTLVCDNTIPFHKCTKISNNKYLLEIIDDYYEDIYNILTPILGGSFEILKAHLVQNGHIYPGTVNKKLMNDNGISCLGSYAECDPLIDIGSVIKKLKNMINRKIIS